MVETNYHLIKNRPKAKRDPGYEKIPELKEIIVDIISRDYENWHNKNLTQPGLEKNILLQKVLSRIKVNLELFTIAANELEIEQKIFKLIDGSFERFVKGL